MNALIQDAVELGATLALERPGIFSGEAYQRQARKVYGAYFGLLIQQRRFSPARIEAGRAGTKFFRVADILTRMVEDRARAELINPLISYHK